MKFIIAILLLTSFLASATENDVFILKMSVPSRDKQCEVVALLNTANTKLKLIQLDKRGGEFDVNTYLKNMKQYEYLGKEYDLTKYFKSEDLKTVNVSAKGAGEDYRLEMNYSLQDGKESFVVLKFSKKPWFKKTDQPVSCISEN